MFILVVIRLNDELQTHISSFDNNCSSTC